MREKLKKFLEGSDVIDFAALLPTVLASAADLHDELILLYRGMGQVWPETQQTWDAPAPLPAHPKLCPCFCVFWTTCTQHDKALEVVVGAPKPAAFEQAEAYCLRNKPRFVPGEAQPSLFRRSHENSGPSPPVGCHDDWLSVLFSSGSCRARCSPRSSRHC